MRVLFLTLYPDIAASPRYRVSQFLPYLREQGIECVVESALKEEEYRRSLDGRMSAASYHLKETIKRFVQVMTASDYDVVVLQKAVMTAYVRGMGSLVRKRSHKLVVDIDDAIHLQPPVSLGWPWKVLEDRDQIARLLSDADLVLAGNRWLEKEVVRLGGTAAYFPTVVDTDQYVPGEDSYSEIYRVGWMGGPSTCGQLSEVKEVLAALPSAQTVLVGADKAIIDVPRAKYIAWDQKTELKELQAFSVGLMPLNKDDWGRGKCALKALLYMACGVPCIATPFGPVADIIEHGVNGLLADTRDEWTDALEQLRDPEERKRIGMGGRETVVREFSLESAAPLYAGLLKGLVE